MKQLFIFNESSQAANYGIGTYIQGIIALLNRHYQIIEIVLSSEKTEYTIIKQRHHQEIHIPKCPVEFCSVDEHNKYMKNVFYLIHPNVNLSQEVFFHFNYTTESSLYEISKSYFPKAKIILTIHYLYWCFTIKGNLSLFRKMIDRNDNRSFDKIEKEVLTIYKNELVHFNSSDFIITLSEFTKKLLISDYKISDNKILLHRNGLKDICPANSYEHKTKVKEALRFSSDSSIILFVGRLNKIKGLDFLIKSFDIVLKKINSAHLLIIGDGDYNEFIKNCKGFGDKLIFMGRLAKDELYKYYQIADVGVIPSFHEQCSYVAIEMMMHGIPIISSTSTGLCEMIENNISGLHIPVIENADNVEIDISLLADKILYLLQNPNEAKRLGKNARKRYEDMYTAEIMQKQLLQFYKQMSENI